MDFEAEESGDDERRKSRRRSVKFDSEIARRGKYGLYFCLLNFSSFTKLSYFVIVETYTKEELERKTEDVDEVIKRLEEKFKDEQQDVKSELYSEYDDADSFVVGDEEIDADMEDLQRDVNLPSNMDSKLWRLKVKPGMERQLVMRLTNKLINHFNNGHPLMVM